MSSCIAKCIYVTFNTKEEREGLWEIETIKLKLIDSRVLNIKVLIALWWILLIMNIKNFIKRTAKKYLIQLPRPFELTEYEGIGD